MTDTLDVLQKTHRCSLNELAAWNSVLSYRYHSLRGADDITILVQHYGSKDEPLPSTATNEPDNLALQLPIPSPPPQVYKTMFQLSNFDQKLVTVTLYYKHKTSKGTLLAQGMLCPGWSEEEFRRLHTIICAIAANGQNGTNRCDMAQALATTPMPFLGTWRCLPPQRKPYRVQTPKLRRSTRRQSDRFRPIAVSSPVVKARLDSLETEVNNLPAALAETRESLVSALRDAEERVKKELKVHMQHKLDNEISVLSSRLTAMEAVDVTKLIHGLQQKVTALEEENKKRKAEVADLQKQLSIANATKPTTGDAECQTSAPPQLQSLQDVSLTPPHVDPAPQSKHGCPLSTQSAPLPSKNLHTPPPSHSPQADSPLSSQQTQVDPASVLVNSPPPGQNQVQNKSSPLARLRSCTIAPDVTHLLLGDSVIRGINMRRSAAATDTTDKVCVPGARVSDLTTWLRKQQPTAVTTDVTCHVGINDCKESVVTAGAWKALFSQCHRVFPHAALTASSILPTKGRLGDTHKTVALSNANLRATCKQLGVRYIDHTTTFTAQSGAPKLNLYKDPFHPSPKGTARLAENLFGLPQDKPPRTQRHYHQSGPPSLFSYYDYPQLQTGPTRPLTLTGQSPPPGVNPSLLPPNMTQSPQFSQPPPRYKQSPSLSHSPPGYRCELQADKRPVSVQSSGTESSANDGFSTPPFFPTYPPPPFFAQPPFSPKHPTDKSRGPVSSWNPYYAPYMWHYPAQQVAAY